MDRYKQIKQIGKGAFGVVYRVVGEDGKEYALKAVKRPKAADRWRVIKREAEVWGSLGEHPNIVSHQGFYVGSNQVALCLELVSGGDCQQLLQRQRSMQRRNLGTSWGPQLP